MFCLPVVPILVKLLTDGIDAVKRSGRGQGDARQQQDDEKLHCDQVSGFEYVINVWSGRKVDQQQLKRRLMKRWMLVFIPEYRHIHF